MKNFLQHVKDNPLDELKIYSGKFITIGLLAKYIGKFEEYINDLEKNCYDSRNFEVIATIPDRNFDLEAIKEICEKSQIEIKLIELPYNYLNSMKSHNIMIKEISDQNTYFYINNSDRCRFLCKNWDIILKQYINAVPDDMFFLRGSNFSKHMKKRVSAQEAYYYPEQWGVYTRKYLNTIGGFLESHTGHDAPSEMIQYFISKNKDDIFKRDILMPNVMHSDIRTTSSKETTGGKERFYERYFINNFFYKSYFTKKGLELCKKASIKILLEHLAWKNNYKDIKIIQKKDTLCIKSNEKIKHKYSFKINFLDFLYEKYYFFFNSNHGLNFVHRFYFILKYKKGFFIMKKIISFLNMFIQYVQNPSKKNILILCLSYVFYFISNLFTRVFLTESISNELEGLIKDDDFRKVLHGEVIKDAYKSKLYCKSLQQIADELVKS